MERLTKEQAVVVSAFTGFLACPFQYVHEEIERRMGRPVWTHEFAGEEFTEQIKEHFKEDFLKLCYEDKNGKEGS